MSILKANRIENLTTTDGGINVNNSGNVGIGTASPHGNSGTNLHIHGSNTTAELRLTNTTTGTGANGSIIQQGGNTLYISNSEAGSTVFENNGSERLRIDSSGRVGIGTSSPTSNRQLTLNGNDAGLQISGSGPAGANTYITLTPGSSAAAYVGTTNSRNLNFVTNGNTSSRMTIDGSGNVGIGTTSPDGKLHVHSGSAGSVTANGNANNLVIENSDTGGISILTPDNGFGYIMWGSPTSNEGAILRYRDSDNIFSIGTEDSAGQLQLRTGAGTEAVRIDSSGNVGIGTATINRPLVVYGNSFSAISINTSSSGTADGDGVQLQLSGSNGYLWNYENGGMLFGTNGTERMRLDSSGALMVGTTTPGIVAGDDLTLSDSENAGITIRSGSSYSGSIYFSDGTSGADEYRGTVQYTHDGNYMRFSTDAAERMRIDSNGEVLIGTTSAFSSSSSSATGHRIEPTGCVSHYRNSGTVVYISRQGDDGNLIDFKQGGSTEGTITVSGSTVSYNGGHLARWSQLTGGAERTEILRGTVLSNLDEMCEWGEESNEQLNRMQVSSVEGDINVSGVFQAWDDDDETYTNDFYCAMTGDFIIRIAQGTTVERGNLLMSAGDGTAKPQGDGFVQDKTIAKVTSTTVSTTYSDGSYCVPCVLMAC